MFASVHNAMSSKEDHFNFPNNFYNVEKALVAGYRAFFLDTCDCTPEEATTMGVVLKFCHGWCSVRHIIENQRSLDVKMKEKN